MDANRILIRDEIEPHGDLYWQEAYQLGKGDRIPGLVDGQVVPMMVLHTAAYGPGQFGITALAPGGVEHHLLVEHDETFVRAEGVMDKIELAKS
ncbi:hypothetical protein ACWFMI_23730 [Nocardiopsis terrae]|uniref:hypothetical protein n=1 Tax=Streptomyces sp. NPDC057554 TaxID=3350538 RepID=UPI0036CD7516